MRSPRLSCGSLGLMKSSAVIVILLVTAVAALAHDWSAAAGRAQAERDIAAGRIRICWGGTIGNGPCGIQYGTRELSVAMRLPKWQLPTGCTVPDAVPASEFGAAYNRVMLAYVRKHGKT